MCHNLMKSIILRNVSQSHKIVTHQVETKFWKKVLDVKYFSLLKPIILTGVAGWPKFLTDSDNRIAG
jgi:hypothetical protein